MATSLPTFLTPIPSFFYCIGLSNFHTFSFLYLSSISLNMSSQMATVNYVIREHTEIQRLFFFSMVDPLNCFNTTEIGNHIFLVQKIFTERNDIQELTGHEKVRMERCNMFSQGHSQEAHRCKILSYIPTVGCKFKILTVA